MRADVPLLLLAALLAPTARGGDPAAALPPSTVAYLSIDVGRAVRELPRLELLELYRDEEVSDFLAGATAYVKAMTREPRAALKLLEMYGLPDIVEGRAVVALVGFGRTDEEGTLRWGAEIEAGRPVSTGDVVLIVETSGREAFAASVERGLELVPEEGETVEVAHAAFPHRVTRFPSLDAAIPGVSHGFVGDTFVATVNPARYLEVAAAVAAGGREEDALAADPAFQRWRAAGPRGTGVLDLYVGLAPVWRSLRPTLEPGPELEVLEAIGLFSVEGAGVSVAAADGRLRDSVAVVTDGRRTGLFSLLDAVHGGGALDEVPSGVDFAAATSVDPGRLVDRLQALLDAVEPGAGEEFRVALDDLGVALGVDVRRDLLGALGPRSAVWSTATAGPIPIPDGGASIALADPARAAELLARLSDGLGPDQGVVMRPFPFEGARAAYSVTGELPFAPALAVVGDRLMAATSGPLLRRRHDATGDGGLRGEDDFGRCLEQNVGQGADDLFGFLYLDLARLTEIGIGLGGPYLPLVAMQAPFEVDPSLLPLPDTVSSYLSGYLLTVRSDGRVVSVDASSPFGGMILSTTALALANWSIEKYEEKRARERARLLKPR
ncbi:MAG: hypothetical protein ACF8XB_24275 [Planctomycetota bacterium JB042]